MVRDKPSLLLFLDYDGTLDVFAPTPDDVLPNPEVIELLSELIKTEKIRPLILSGRKLPHLQKLIPLKNIILAGTYGLEIQTQNGEILSREDYQKIRPEIEEIKTSWQEILKGKPHFYLEDKGWTIAIHAKDAENNLAKEVLEAAATKVKLLPEELNFRLISGHKFLEIGPDNATKTDAVEYLLTKYCKPNEFCLYIGDDDKDEGGMVKLKQLGGYAIKVTNHSENTIADWQLSSPREVRTWLNSLLKIYQKE
ncbi:MAG: trehalose-phosphatase [Anaerolineales bacterium]|nr:trehalose-phosphatase [Anaerolineales bacterium]